MVARGVQRLAAILAIAGSGCVVMVPERRTTSQVVRIDRSPLVVGPVGGIVVEAEIVGSEIRVRTTRHRSCQHTIERVVEQRKKRVAKLESGGSPDFNGATAPGILVWIALLPVVFAASSLVTGVIVGLDGTEVARMAQSDGAERFACPAQAMFTQLEIVFPSGALITGATDALGRATFALPAAEPPSGAVIVRAVGVVDPPPPPAPDPDMLITDPAPVLPAAIPEIAIRYGD